MKYSYSKLMSSLLSPYPLLAYFFLLEGCFFLPLNFRFSTPSPADQSTVDHKSHDPCFHKKYLEAGVMTFVAHCTSYPIVNTSVDAYISMLPPSPTKTQLGLMNRAEWSDRRATNQVPDETNIYLFKRT